MLMFRSAAKHCCEPLGIMTAFFSSGVQSPSKPSETFLNKLEKNVYLGKLKYIDLYSFYRYFIIQEFCGDIDTVLSSFNVHKKKRREQNDTFFSGNFFLSSFS